MLIIGCGNRNRGDDAVGLLVAGQLQQSGLPAHIHTRIHNGDALTLIELWRGVDEVILVDAVSTGALIGTVFTWEHAGLPSVTSSPASSHGVGVAEAIALAESLESLPNHLRVYGIEGKRFGIGEEMAVEVKIAAQKLVHQLLTELQ